MSQHSPLPWSTGTDEDAHVIYDRELDAVADSLRDDGDGETEAANAEFIVRAVNSHADLLAACELVEKTLGCLDPTAGEDALPVVRAAIAKAKTPGTA